jgi:hypothetical protein
MSVGSRTTFSKRQEERARQERQAEKAQKKAQAKQEQTSPTNTPSELLITHDEEGQTVDFDFHGFANRKLLKLCFGSGGQYAVSAVI